MRLQKANLGMHSLWRIARGPFHAVTCEAHQWERYDAHRGGCRRCGAAHECKNNHVDSTCPLVHLDDGSLCCTITGYCPPIVRYAKVEYIDHAICTAPKPTPQAPDMFAEICSTIEWFLLGSVYNTCKEDEIAKTLSRCQSLAIKALKRHKTERPGVLPVLPEVLAEIFHSLPLRQSTRATPELCRQCADHVVHCFLSLRLGAVPAKRTSLVVGILYLMKQGLVIQNVQWLPRVPALQHCLPHETALEKTFKLSMKLVCETENEIKLALRNQVKML